MNAHCHAVPHDYVPEFAKPRHKELIRTLIAAAVVIVGMVMIIADAVRRVHR